MARPVRRLWSVRDSVLLVVLLATATYVHRDAIADMFLLGFRLDDQSHALLAPGIAAWLFWLRRSRLRTLVLSASLLGPVLAGGGWILSWAAIATDTLLLWHAAPLITLIGCVISVAGVDVIRRFAPAFGALFFLIPLPATIQQLVGVPLQAMTTDITQLGLELLGVSATRQGLTLIINGEHVAVGEACNGMRMILALALVVYAFAFSVNFRPSARGLLLTMSPLVAVLCNVLRLMPTTVLYGYFSASTAEDFHDLSGWLMLPAALVILIGLLRTLRWIELPVTTFRLALR